MLNKVFKYIETEQLANTLKFSADDQNAGYKLGGKGSITIGTPDILWENIAFIQDKKIIWTHGEFYCDVSEYEELTAIAILDLNDRLSYIEDDISNFIDLSQYVSKTELNHMGYVSSQELSSQSYLSEIPSTYLTYAAITEMGYATYSYVQSAYSYLINTIIDNELVIALTASNLNNRIGILENAGYLTYIPSSYASYTYVEAAYSYLMTKISVLEISGGGGSGSGSGSGSGDGISGIVLNGNTVPLTNNVAVISDVVMANTLNNYVSKTELSGQSYLSSIPNTYPTYAAISDMGYVTQSDLTANSYITQTSLSSNSYAGYAYVYTAYSYIMSYIDDRFDDFNVEIDVGDVTFPIPDLTDSGKLLLVGSDGDFHLAYNVINQLNGDVNLTDYVTKQEIETTEFIISTSINELNSRVTAIENGESIASGVTFNVDLSDYALKSDLNTYAKKTDLNTYTKLSYAFAQYPSYTYLEQRLSTMDLSTYVSKTELSSQSYITPTVLSNQGYLTTHQDLSTYISKTELSNLGYVTYSYTFGEYPSYTYLEQRLSVMDLSTYVSKTELTAQSYLTSIPNTYPTYTAISDMGYITQTSLSANSYAGYTYVYDSYAYIMGKINTLELAAGGGGSGTVAEGGITAISFNGTPASITGSVATITAPINDPTVQIQIDNETYSFTLNQSTAYTINLGSVIRTQQDLSTYVSKTELTAQSYVASSTLDNYVSKTELSAQGYITSGLPTVTSNDNGKILMVVNGAWQLVLPSTIYSGNATPSNANGNNGDIYLQS